MAENFKTKFQCPKCDFLYDGRWDAQNCCEPDKVYVCEFCEDVYHFERPAKECCVSEETGKEIIPKKYLEAHGQKRLF